MASQRAKPPPPSLAQPLALNPPFNADYEERFSRLERVYGWESTADSDDDDDGSDNQGHNDSLVEIKKAYISDDKRLSLEVSHKILGEDGEAVDDEMAQENGNTSDPKGILHAESESQELVKDKHGRHEPVAIKLSVNSLMMRR